MKKLFLGLATLATMTVFAQTTNLERAVDATEQGKTFVGVDATSLGFTKVEDGVTNFNVGLTAGKFVVNNLALVGTVGYDSIHYKEYNSNDWYYGAGVKYYLGSLIPLQVDWTGSTGNSYHPSTSYVGFQGGFAWFPFNNFSVEPRLRYELSTKDEYRDVFSGGLGFNLHF